MSPIILSLTDLLEFDEEKSMIIAASKTFAGLHILSVHRVYGTDSYVMTKKKMISLGHLGAYIVGLTLFNNKRGMVCSQYKSATVASGNREHAEQQQKGKAAADLQVVAGGRERRQGAAADSSSTEKTQTSTRDHIFDRPPCDPKNESVCPSHATKDARGVLCLFSSGTLSCITYSDDDLGDDHPIEMPLGPKS
jgi:hypothetical protein